jgi:CRISPR-associated helicase Cas3
VNRRVLVQQVFVIAKELCEQLKSNGSTDLDELRNGLQNLSGDPNGIFRAVELRGQIRQDTEWPIRPTVPQLIIGTVDQIGSRILFQGYSLGKWGRPQHAALLGVDAWIAVDESHLVPAFVITLRQLREQCASPAENLPAPLNALIARLPFWLTELSATPGLPPPSRGPDFSLTDEEKTDPNIADRILAANTRRVAVDWLPKTDKPKEVLIKRLIAGALSSKAKRIAIFVREVAVADAVAKGIAAELKKKEVDGSCICKITGRIRGYERDRLVKHPAFQSFLRERQANQSESGKEETCFLIGTAAAEVGLDADADVILCDFASLVTLLQRLGRLDRRGFLTQLHITGHAERPTMWVFASKDETKPKIVRAIERQLEKLTDSLKTDLAPWSAELMTGTHWLSAGKKDDNSSDEQDEEKAPKDQTQPLIDAATWLVLAPLNSTCTQPASWLDQSVARVAAGPLVVPPVTDAVLDYWSATSDARSPHLSPHPFLYGLAEDDNSTPLVGVAFRLEVEALRPIAVDDDSEETPDSAAAVSEIFNRFPPLRAELHQVKLATVRDWLSTDAAKLQPLAYRHGDKWVTKAPGESTSDVRSAIGPNGTLVLAAKLGNKDEFKKLMVESEEKAPLTYHDVLDGVSQSAFYLRVIGTGSIAIAGRDGALAWDFEAESPELGSAKVKVPPDCHKPLIKTLNIGGESIRFSYFRRKWDSSSSSDTSSPQFLDDFEGRSGHRSLSEAEAVRIATAIAPEDAFLIELLAQSAHGHDEGKRFPKWQHAFGGPEEGRAIAKLHPKLAKPSSLSGFRHEWESLRYLERNDASAPDSLSVESRRLWLDLLFHLTGSHHGHLRPSITNSGLTPDAEPIKHNALRLESAERFVRLQRQLGRWRLAYLEALLKSADAIGSRDTPDVEGDDET